MKNIEAFDGHILKTIKRQNIRNVNRKCLKTKLFVTRLSINSFLIQQKFVIRTIPETILNDLNLKITVVSKYGSLYVTFQMTAKFSPTIKDF